MVLLLSLGKASGAVVFTPLSDAAYSTLKSTPGTTVSWTAIFQAGASTAGTSNIETEYLLSTPSGSNPNSGGQHSWNMVGDGINDSISVAGDSIANIDIYPGSSSVSTRAYTSPGFNKIMIPVSDFLTPFGGTQFIDGLYNGNSVTDISADNGYSRVMIDLSEDSPVFSITGRFVSTPLASGDTESVMFEGVYVPVPEPSSMILVIVGFVFTALRRSR